MAHFLRFTLILFQSVILISNTNGEIIDGPANLRDKPHGKVIASLLDKSRVEVEDREGDWYKVRVLFFMKAEPGENFPVHINKGSKLLTDSGTDQGVTMDRIHVEDGPWSDKNRNHLTFTAWTHKQNIIRESLIENYLTSLVNEGNRNLASSEWQKYLAINDFGSFVDKEPFDSYMLYVNDYYDVSPGPRVLLFAVNNKLFAVLHDREIDLGKDAIKEEVARYHVTILDKSNPDLIRKFRTTYYPTIRIAD